MQVDVNVIVDVDPDEASKLIWLVEFLIDDWYVVPHVRETPIKEVIDVGTAKALAQGKEPRKA